MAVEVRKTDPQDIEPRKALERFVAENDDLLTLEARIGRFNIWFFKEFNGWIPG